MTNKTNQPIIFPSHSTIRILRLQNRKRTPVIPVLDVSKTTGIPANNFRYIIYRNSDLLDGLFSDVTSLNRYEKKLKSGLIKTIFRKQKLLCGTKEGWIAVFLKISTNRIADKTSRAKILEFQHKAIKIIDAVIDGRLPKDFRLNFYDILGLPTGSLVADGIRQYSKEKGLSVKTGYRHLRIARIQNGLEPSTKKTRSDKGSTWYPEEKARVLAYKKEHPEEGYKAICTALELQHIKYTVKKWLKETT